MTIWLRRCRSEAEWVGSRCILPEGELVRRGIALTICLPRLSEREGRRRRLCRICSNVRAEAEGGRRRCSGLRCILSKCEGRSLWKREVEARLRCRGRREGLALLAEGESAVAANRWECRLLLCWRKWIGRGDAAEASDGRRVSSSTES